MSITPLFASRTQACYYIKTLPHVYNNHFCRHQKNLQICFALSPRSWYLGDWTAHVSMHVYHALRSTFRTGVGVERVDYVIISIRPMRCCAGHSTFLIVSGFLTTSSAQQTREISREGELDYYFSVSVLYTTKNITYLLNNL